MIKKILLLILIIFAFAQYGKYCGDGNTNLYGEKPIDLVDDICRIRKICMKAMLTNYCNCQAGISALSIEITGLSSGAENQRELLVNSGMPGSFWSDGCESGWYPAQMGYIKIVPVINTAYHNGFNYYTIFNDENRFYQFYGWGLFYITTFDNIFDYNVVARDSHLDPMAFKKNINSNLLSNFTALNDNIIVITNIIEGEQNGYNLVFIWDSSNTFYQREAQIWYDNY